MESANWYRVIDPMSPLFGCDVGGILVDGSLLLIKKMRRIDITVGDRPFQLIAPEGQNLGLWINTEHISESPVQDDIIEMTRGTPYGKFISEDLLKGMDDGAKLMIVRFEEAVQFALLDVDGKLMANDTWYGTDIERMEIEAKFTSLFRTDVEKLVIALKTGNPEV